jgi:hypothetical protein
MRADSSKVILARGLLAELPEPPKPCWFAVAPNRSGGGAYDAPSGGPTYRSGRSPDWLKIKNPACEGGLRAAIKKEMAPWRLIMKQRDRAKGNELAVALMVERIKSTATCVGITPDRARELVARGVRMVGHGNAECNLSKDDLKTARLRNRLPPWDIGLLERKLFGTAETRWQID